MWQKCGSFCRKRRARPAAAAKRPLVDAPRAIGLRKLALARPRRKRSSAELGCPAVRARLCVQAASLDAPKDNYAYAVRAALSLPVSLRIIRGSQARVLATCVATRQVATNWREREARLNVIAISDEGLR
ncbi:hypothetical protein MTO96_023234 [Rhipicephalus appendiculatus]